MKSCNAWNCNCTTCIHNKFSKSFNFTLIIKILLGLYGQWYHSALTKVFSCINIIILSLSDFNVFTFTVKRQHTDRSNKLKIETPHRMQEKRRLSPCWNLYINVYRTNNIVVFVINEFENLFQRYLNRNV